MDDGCIAVTSIDWTAPNNPGNFEITFSTSVGRPPNQLREGLPASISLRILPGPAEALAFAQGCSLHPSVDLGGELIPCGLKLIALDKFGNPTCVPANSAITVAVEPVHDDASASATVAPLVTETAGGSQGSAFWRLQPDCTEFTASASLSLSHGQVRFSPFV